MRPPRRSARDSSTSFILTSHADTTDSARDGESPSNRAPRSAVAASEPAAPTRTLFALYVAVVAALACVAIGLAAPVLGHPAHLGFMLLGALAVGVASRFAWSRRAGTVRFQAFMAASAALLVAAFWWGAATSVIIDGTVQSNLSDTARVYHSSQELRESLVRLAAADELLAYSDADAQARFDQYAPTAEELAEINRRWSEVTTADDLGDERLLVVVDKVRAAAVSGQQAVEARARTVVQPDPVAAERAAGMREPFVTNVLEAGSLLHDIAAFHGIDVSLREDGGPVE